MTTSFYITNPNESLPIPKWIDEEYFEDILPKDIPNFSRILHFQTIAATAPGVHYSSVTVRVVMEVELKDGTKKPMTYFIKTCIESGEGAAFLKTMNMFPREKQMYQTLLPQFEKLYKEAGVDIKFSSKTLRIDETPERITIVLEDLKRLGFKHIDRLKGMDFEHVSRSLHKIAELHAVSAMHFELNGAFDQMFMAGFFDEAKRSSFEVLHKNRQKSLFRAMRDWGVKDVELYINSTPPSEKLFEERQRISAVDPNEFNVLNHGDCSPNNIMFKYKENGDIDETIFVDYQVGNWGTPAQDLWYFIITSAALDIKTKEFDRFINIYHTRLVECLTKLKYPKKIPTLKELHILMLKYGYYGVFAANYSMALVYYPYDKDASLDNFFKVGPAADEFRYKLFSNPLYTRAYCQIYPFFWNKGIWKIQ